MTDHQHELAQALARCTLPAGSTPKRFVRWASTLPEGYALSPRAAAFLEKLAHAYRRQLGRCMAESCAACAPALKATERPCPACGAPAGKPCRKKSKTRKQFDPRVVHAARLQGATE